MYRIEDTASDYIVTDTLSVSSCVSRSDVGRNTHAFGYCSPCEVFSCETCRKDGSELSVTVGVQTTPKSHKPDICPSQSKHGVLAQIEEDSIGTRMSTWYSKTQYKVVSSRESALCPNANRVTGQKNENACKDRRSFKIKPMFGRASPITALKPVDQNSVHSSVGKTQCGFLQSTDRNYAQTDISDHDEEHVRDCRAANKAALTDYQTMACNNTSKWKRVVVMVKNKRLATNKSDLTVTKKYPSIN